jgi:HD-GYP domain-containing protein (c-di-GMP phosphodiesterase class II)/uncharacterized membrane protein affecting hemolysin expression
MGLLSKFRIRKIRTRIFLLVTTLVALIFTFFVFYFPKRLESEVLKALSARYTSLVDLTAFSLDHALASNDRKRLEEIIQRVREKNELAYLMVLDDSGKVVTSYNRPVAEARDFKRVDGDAPAFRPGMLFRTAAPLLSEDRSFGRLFLGFSLDKPFRDLRRHQKTIGLVSLVALAGGILLVFFLSAFITQPLTAVTRTAERIARGDLKQRAKVGSDDEIGKLARSFNTMVDSLQVAHGQLEEFNRALEHKVEARAQDLEKEVADRRRAERELRIVKEELEHQVTQRTDQLAQANVELQSKVLDTKRAEDQLQNTLGKLQKALEGTVKAMSLTIEMRDLYTAGHQRRVMNLAVAIAMEMNLPQDKIEGIRMAGVIHDLGKIAMPAEILSKPTRLSRTEFQLIKDHPRIGYDILKTIEFPWPVAHIVLQHHERMDGSGYPDGLVGDAILLEARILAVADHVEAMSSHRPYRPALGLDKALEEIRRGRGIQFDAQVVDACIKLFREKRFHLEAEVNAWS